MQCAAAARPSLVPLLLLFYLDLPCSFLGAFIFVRDRKTALCFPSGSVGSSLFAIKKSGNHLPYPRFAGREHYFRHQEAYTLSRGRGQSGRHSKGGAGCLCSPGATCQPLLFIHILRGKLPLSHFLFHILGFRFHLWLSLSFASLFARI